MTLPKRPLLASGVRLHFDNTRSAWLLLAPERVIEMEGTAHDIVSRCDGARTVDEIVTELAWMYDEDRTTIDTGVKDILTELMTKGLLARNPHV